MLFPRDTNPKEKDAILNEENGHSSISPFAANLDESTYLVKDVNFRKVINRHLGKSGTLLETYSATAAELETITLLNLYSINNPMSNYLKVESLEGIEYLKNLKTLQLMYAIIPEEALVDIGKLENLTTLTINSTLFSGNDTTTILLNKQINEGPIEAQMLFPIDNHINLGPLSNLQKLESLSITINGFQQNAEYSYSARTHFDVSGLDGLTAGDFAEVDDPSFDFLRNLTQLKGLNLYSTPLNNVEALATLQTLTTPMYLILVLFLINLILMGLVL